GVLNRYLNGTGTEVGNQDIINQLSQQLDPMQFTFNGQTGAGPSDAYSNAMQQLFGLAGQGNNLINQFTNPGNMPAAPNAPGAGNVERLNSQGLLGDRSNVANAISDYFNRQTQDNLADTRARLTATGG